MKSGETHLEASININTYILRNLYKNALKHFITLSGGIFFSCISFSSIVCATKSPQILSQLAQNEFP